VDARLTFSTSIPLVALEPPQESLKCHPDRLPPSATDAERRRATQRFQQVADVRPSSPPFSFLSLSLSLTILVTSFPKAYYTLSDPVRRREYDLHAPMGTTFPTDPFEDEGFSEAGPPPTRESTSSVSRASYLGERKGGGEREERTRSGRTWSRRGTDVEGWTASVARAVAFVLGRRA
jgi:hypothetical protein